MKYSVWNLGVWKNKEEEYTVNNRHKIGELELPKTPKDTEILTALDEAGLISPLENLNLDLLEVVDFYPDYQIDYDGMPQLDLTCEDRGLSWAHWD